MFVQIMIPVGIVRSQWYWGRGKFLKRNIKKTSFNIVLLINQSSRKAETRIEASLGGVNGWDKFLHWN